MKTIRKKVALFFPDDFLRHSKYKSLIIFQWYFYLYLRFEKGKGWGIDLVLLAIIESFCTYSKVSSSSIIIHKF